MWELQKSFALIWRSLFFLDRFSFQKMQTLQELQMPLVIMWTSRRHRIDLSGMCCFDPVSLMLYAPIWRAACPSAMGRCG